MTAWGALFPLEVSSWEASPVFNTDITVGRNGQEVRNALWQDPLHEFNAAFAVRSYDDIETLKTFFLVMRGQEQSFLIKDWSDYKVDDWTAFAETVDGTRTTFQLIKNYVHGVAGTYTRTITKPKAIEGVGGVQIRDNGVTVNVADYSFSSVTGIVTFGVAPLAGHTIDFKIDEFYVPVRFMTDQLPVQLLNYWVAAGADISNVGVPDIPMREVRGE